MAKTALCAEHETLVLHLDVMCELYRVPPLYLCQLEWFSGVLQNGTAAKCRPTPWLRGESGEGNSAIAIIGRLKGKQQI